jgi:50S ribosomal protein L16 3-hydroxylase
VKLPISESRFLREYWQQKPLLLPQALPGFSSPLSAEELAGFAMESFVESRLVAKSHGVWTQQAGPFNAQDFDRDDEWTLLVHGLDQWHAGVAALRTHVDFLPRWRFDDIMVSYAIDGAGVGPHFDRYDVFLLQGDGSREWRVGGHCDDDTPQLQANGLTLISEFEPTDTYLLAPGDILYIPPGIAHWGIARGTSLTFSLGFRAPSIADLLAHRADNLLELLATTSLLEDMPDLPPGRPGEITLEHIRNAKDALANASDALDNHRWFGETVTRERASEADDFFDSQLSLTGPCVRLSGRTRVAWTEREQHLDVFINGETFEVPSSAIHNLMALCRQEHLVLAHLADADETLLTALVAMGAIEDCDNDGR